MSGEPAKTNERRWRRKTVGAACGSCAARLCGVGRAGVASRVVAWKLPFPVDGLSPVHLGLRVMPSVCGRPSMVLATLDALGHSELGARRQLPSRMRPHGNALQPGRFNKRTSCGTSRSKARPRWLKWRFTVGAQFAERVVVFGNQKVRVVAEAVRAAGGGRDPAAAIGFELQADGARRGRRPPRCRRSGRCAVRRGRRPARGGVWRCWLRRSRRGRCSGPKKFRGRL